MINFAGDGTGIQVNEAKNLNATSQDRKTGAGLKMTRVARIKLEVAIPDGVTKAQAKEWLRFVLNDFPEMSGDNPLVDRELEPHFFEVEFDDRG